MKKLLLLLFPLFIFFHVFAQPCCTSHFGTGCGNFGCQSAICALDSWCCSSEWDGLCASEAINNANSGGACAGVSDCPGGSPPPSGTCCTSNGTPGCENAACQTAICALDAFCCSSSWDALCAGAAVTDANSGGPCAGVSDCPGASPPPTSPSSITASSTNICAGNNVTLTANFPTTPPGPNPCCTSHGATGCENAACQTAICALDAFCCSSEWDALCAGAAVTDANSGGPCAGVSDCPGALPSTGTVYWFIGSCATTGHIATGNPISVSPTATTTYFARTFNGVSWSASCASVTITVNPAPSGGSASAPQTICAGDSPSNLTLTGHTGTIQWQWGNSSTGPWNNIVGATGTTLTSVQMGALTATRFFRAVVSSTPCTPANSNVVQITVNPAPAGGTASAPQTICAGDSPSNLTLTGHTGTIQWQWGNSSTGPWNNIAGATGTTLTSVQMGTLTATRFFRALVSSASCTPANSNVVEITVNPAPSGGTASASQSICLGTVPNDLTLSGHSGNVQWEQASSAIGPWSPIIGANAPTLTGIQMGQINSTTFYRASLSLASCPAVFSNVVEIDVPAPSNTLTPGATATCVLNQNGWIHFLDAAGRLIVSIDPNGENLGNVTATSYVSGAPITGTDCDDPTNPLYETSVLGRHWVITPQFQPTSNVTIRLPLDVDSELGALITASNSNANPSDDVNSISDLILSRYPGPANVDDNLANNCASAGGDENTTIHAQAGDGLVSDFAPLSSHSPDDRYVEFSIGSFSEFWLHGSDINSPLPATFNKWNAKCEADFVQLNWSTFTEINVLQYIVERSRDGISWEEIGSVSAAGNSANLTEYKYEDSEVNSLFNGYYRLVEESFDGEQVIYGPFSVNCSNINNSFGVDVFPNPATNQVQFAVLAKEKAGQVLTIQLYDSYGKKVRDLEYTLQEFNDIIWDLENINNGFYSIRFKLSDGEQMVKKLVINK